MCNYLYHDLILKSKTSSGKLKKTEILSQIEKECGMIRQHLNLQGDHLNMRAFIHMLGSEIQLS